MSTRRLVVSVLALAASSAFAQPTNVTVYGLLDLGVSRVTGLLAGTNNAVVSGIMEGSRLGFKGGEDLGGGYRVLFTIGTAYRSQQWEAE